MHFLLQTVKKNAIGTHFVSSPVAKSISKIYLKPLSIQRYRHSVQIL